MKPHDRLDARARELAALHALDALPKEESAAYEAHLGNCSACRQEVASLREAAEELFLLAPSVQPAASVKNRLIERVRAQAQADTRPPSPVLSSVSSPGGSQRMEESPHQATAEADTLQPWRHWAAGVQGGSGLSAGRPEPRRESEAGGRPAQAHALTRAAEALWEGTGFEGVETRRLFVDPAHDRVTMLIRMAAGSSYPAHRHKGPEECYVIEGDLRSGSLAMHAGDFKFSDVDSKDVRQSTVGGCLLLIVSSMHDELLPDSAAID